jgi:hypothetical protein
MTTAGMFLSQGATMRSSLVAGSSATQTFQSDCAMGFHYECMKENGSTAPLRIEKGVIQITMLGKMISQCPFVPYPRVYKSGQTGYLGI